MSRRRNPVILTEALREHPAVRAWMVATTSQPIEPACVIVLRERVPAAIYSLAGVGRDGGAVYAKRSRIPRIAVEQVVYEQILPKLPLPTPGYYGAVANGEYGWIFVEDVGGHRYCQDEPEHRAAAARWLATMHTTAVDIPAVRSLPGAGPARYLRHLRAGRERTLRSMSWWAFAGGELDILNEVVAFSRALETRWADLEVLCRGAPDTLVHCDFQPKNAFFTHAGAGLTLRLIDWEMAGYGPPAPDLTRVDLRSYWSAIQPRWPQMSFETVERLARAGQVLQWTAAIDWESASLECRAARDRSDAVTQLQIALQRLIAATHAAGVLE